MDENVYQLEFFTTNNYKRTCYTEVRKIYTINDDTIDSNLELWVKEYIHNNKYDKKDSNSYGYTFVKLTDENKDKIGVGIPFYLMPSGKLISDSEFCCLVDNIYGDKIITNNDARESAFAHFGNDCILIYPNMISASAIDDIKDIMDSEKSQTNTTYKFSNPVTQADILPCNLASETTSDSNRNHSHITTSSACG